MVVNGIHFSMDLWLPNFVDSQKREINEMIDLVLLDLNDINKMFVVCKTYSGVTYDEHYGCYGVDTQSLQAELTLIKVSEFLSKHYYPVKMHYTQNKLLFRCKRF